MCNRARVIRRRRTTPRLCPGKETECPSSPFSSPCISPLILLRFNIYIYDYCFKRGFRKTARELLVEADIPAESQPPINAKQGLLFEYAISLWICPSAQYLTCSRWWSVFWVLFTAKASGNGSEDALLYTQVCRFFLSIIPAYLLVIASITTTS